MKHLFTIHSPLTFLVAYATIEHLGLKREDVILLSQKYRVPVDGFRVEPAFQDKYSSFWSRLSKFNVPVHYDRYIDELTGSQPFTAYVDLMSYYQKILVTHERCQAFHFMEEGNSAYQVIDDLTDLSWADRADDYRVSSITSKTSLKAIVRTLRGYNLRLLSIPYHYMCYSNFKDLKYFVFSENAFYNAPREKKVILRPDGDQPAMQEMAKVNLVDEVVWIDGSNGRYTGLSESYYHRAIDKAIIKLKAEGVLKQRVYAKLRPGITNLEDNYLVSTLKKAQLEVEVLPDGMVLESFFITSHNCVVIGTLTAALEYAHAFGHQALSIYGLFEKRPPTFFDRMDGFWRNVKLLEN